jgi:hypothetical protein
MRLGDGQSVFQIAIALNFAYFSFREIRTPGLAALATTVSQIGERLTLAQALLRSVKRPERLQAMDEATSLWNTRYVIEAQLRMHEFNLGAYKNPYDENMESFDRLFRVASLITGAIGGALLLLSSLYANASISRPAFLIGALVCFLPTIGSILYGIAMVGLIDATRKDLASLGRDVDDIVGRIHKEIVPRAEALYGKS